MARKLHSTSTFARLTAEDRAHIDDLLINGAGYAEILDHLKTRGLHCSITSISEYYQNHVLPEKWARQKRIAAQLATLRGGETLDTAALNAVRQRVLDLTLTPGSDPKLIRTLYTLLIQAKAQELDARKLALLEAKAAAADAAKAALQAKVSSGGLTPEALALAEEQLKLL